MTKEQTNPEAEPPEPEGWQVPEALSKRWYSRATAAEVLKVSVDTIDRWVKDGRLTKRDYYGGHTLILKESVTALLAPFI